MRRSNQWAALLFTGFMVAGVSGGGCSSTGVDRSERATTTMETMDKDAKQAAEQLDVTGVSLDELMRPGLTDVKRAFNACSENISRIERIEQTFAIHADEMKARGAEYFQEWQKEGNKYHNPQIRELSEQRRIELFNVYGTIAESSINVKQPFKGYVSDVKEIQSYLSNDLTSKGIEAIAPVSRKAISDGDNLKSAIKSLRMALEKAKSEMAQNGL